MKGAMVEGAPKKGGAAAIDEAVKPSAMPAVPSAPGAVSAPASE